MLTLKGWKTLTILQKHIKMEDEVSGVDPVFPDTLSLPHNCSDLFLADGTPASHWQGVISYLNSIGRDELERRHQKAMQIMYDHGAAYSVLNTDAAQERPWKLDPIPFPIPADTGNYLEQGIKQRTRLLAALFDDIYGPQTLLRTQQLPPELLFANPRFLRPCHGLIPGHESMTLHLHATDVCRFNDGRWRVVSNRTQIPTGAGYALENRIILSRILPRMFHSGNVLRLVPFFKQLTQALMEISGMEKREPNIVMLSPGASSANYFEHAFLSRYLGFTLVESSDLTVRNDAVFLKTLGGLHPVDVILRQIEDIFCDPLAFGSNSLNGVPGLVQAIRAGNVIVSNPLGSTVLESPALTPFLPKLCRQLLEEELILEGVPTLWGGTETGLNEILNGIVHGKHPMVISSAFGLSHPPPVNPRKLSSDKMEALCQAILKRPYAYVAVNLLTPCTLPVWEKEDLCHRHAAMRIFSSAVCHNRPNPNPDPTLKMPSVQMDGKTLPVVISDITDKAAIAPSVSVMPGALTQLFDDPSAMFLLSGAHQGGSKDTWCYTDGSISYQSMLHRFTEPIEIHRGSDLSSRVADNMLWLGRYLERTEGMLRVIRTVLDRLNSETRLNLIPEFPLLLRLISNLKITPTPFSQTNDGYQIRNLETEMLDVLFNTQSPGSFQNSLGNVSRVAASVRDRLSNDSWHILRRMESDLKKFSPHRNNRISETHELVNDLLITISAFSGLALESMTRGMGWRFMDIGRRLERTSYMLTLLQSLFSETSTPDRHELEALLEVADCTITYHTRYRTTLQVAPVVDLLLLDELNPRAVGFQLAALSDHMANLPRSLPHPFRTREEKMMLDLTTQLRLTDIHELMAYDKKSDHDTSTATTTPDATTPLNRPPLQINGEDNNGSDINRSHEAKDTSHFALNALLKRLNDAIKTLANQITQHYLSRVETEKQLRNAFEKFPNE